MSPWVNVTSNLQAIAGPNAGDAWASCQPGSARVIALVSGAGLFASDDKGANWRKLGTGTGSAVINHGPTSVAYDPQHSATFWESGIYGDGIYRTTDNGLTFQRLGMLGHNDVVSVDFSDPNRQTILAGTHERTRMLFLSRNGGESFTDIGATLPANSSFSSAPHVVDAQTFLLGVAGYGGSEWGVYRSTNGGATWSRASTEGAVGMPLKASNGNIYWSLESDGGMIVSTDRGANWKKTADGPVRLYSGAPVELPDGRIVTLGRTHLLASADHGASWQRMGAPLPFPGANCGTYGVTYCPAWQSFFIQHNDCSGRLTNDAIWSAGLEGG
jgi:photosystem II stability/assembly factor-like uncharacterized protein